ncbi:bacteriocin [Vibrio brasiliensis]|jgi:bacteriocin-like protein|nr:bacteriocin [Vibrio brasiliensis]MCG9781317.1 bacteriocin [Vibrio brasiliensis]
MKPMNKKDLKKVVGGNGAAGSMRPSNGWGGGSSRT